MTSNLKEKTVKGISWNLMENISVYFVRLVIGVILARLLTPADFGLIGMVTVFFAIAEVFINGGFGQAYIQKKDASDIDANTVFIINLTLSLLIYILLWIFAPAISIFYNQPLLVKLLRVMSVIVILNSFNVIQLAQIRRDLSFKRKSIITFCSSLLSGLIGIYFAYTGFGVWSIVIQQIANRAFICTGLFFTSTWKFKFVFSYASFKSMFSYGSWILGANLIAVAFNNLYRFIIGKLYPVSELGLYDRAQQFPSMISQQLSWSVNMVALPVFSKLQDNVAELKKATTKFIKYLAFISFPLLITLIIVADPFVVILLTTKWSSMITYLQLLCIVGILVPFYDINIQAYQSIGKTKFVFIINLIKNCLRVLNIILAYRFGVKFIIIGEIITSSITYIIISVFSKKKIGFSFFNQLSEIKWIVLSIILAGFIGIILYNCFDLVLLKLFIPSIAVGLTYLLFIYIFDKNFLLEVYSLKSIFLKK